MNIQVLLYDDEEKIDFVGLAELEGIDITHFKSARECIDELKLNSKFYHAVILDAKGIADKDDQKTGLDGLRKLRDYLKELNAKQYLPHFIFTGQPDYLSNKMFKESFGEFLIKGKDEQVLIDKIKNAVISQDEFIIHQKHSDFFEAVSNLFDKEIHQYFTELLVSINSLVIDFNDKLHFTQLRIILEHLFRKANRVGLLHDKCLDRGKVNLTESSLFLAGEQTKHLKERCSVTHFPKLIADGVKEILFITGAASHTTDPELDKHLDLVNYRRAINSPYLLHSLTFRLMDIVLWFDNYLNENYDYEINKSYWISMLEDDLVTGVVIRIAENGYGTFKPNDSSPTLSIIPIKVRELGLCEGQIIKVKLEKKDSKTLIVDIEV